MNEFITNALVISQIFTPEIKNACFEPIAQRIGSTLAYLFDSTIGWKIKYMYERNEYLKGTDSFKKQVSSELNKIDEENLQEPKTCIAGPMFDAANFFIEEAIYIEIFSKLIAASCDSRYNEILHPAFAEVIKQLSPLDALLIKFLHYKQNINGYAVSKDGIDFSIVECDLVDEYGIECVAQSVSNLSRLGIFFIQGYEETRNTVSFVSDNNVPQTPPMNTPFTNSLEESGFKVMRSRYYITNFGYQFMKVCLS